MEAQILLQILETLKSIESRLDEMQSGNISTPVTEPVSKPAEETSSQVSDIQAWLNEKNGQAEQPEESGSTDEVTEVVFEMLPGVDPANFADYVGKPMSEVDMNVIQMIARPDYATKFAPKKFPQNVIDAAKELAV